MMCNLLPGEEREEEEIIITNYFIKIYIQLPIDSNNNFIDQLSFCLHM